MIRSMTGFGEADTATAAGRIRVELRTVNHRYLNVNAKLPPSLARYETDVREWLRGAFQRGHVNLVVRVERDPAVAVRNLRVDPEAVAGYLGLFGELRDRFGVPGEADLSLLSRFADIFVKAEPESEAAEVPADSLRDAIRSAAQAAVRMRVDEGMRLRADLEGRLDAISAALEEIEALAPQRLRDERERLQAAIRELAGGVGLDESRLSQEIAVLAERWDIHEELVRFRSHLALFRELLEAEDSEGVGKRLAFLVQEMHREANTTGSKANSAPIAHRVVAIKDEIERLREQVENVE